MSYRVSFRVERRHWNPHQVTSCNRFRLSESNRRKRFHVIQGRPFQSAFIVGFFFEFSIRVDSFLFTCHSVCFSFVVQIPLRNRFFFFVGTKMKKKGNNRPESRHRETVPRVAFVVVDDEKKNGNEITATLNEKNGDNERKWQVHEVIRTASLKKKTSFDWKFAIISSKEIDKCPPDTIMGCAIEPWPTLDRHRRMNRS